MNSLKGKHVLVTGATGFIGANLVRTLLQEGARVSIFVRQQSSPWRIKDIIDKVEIHYGDLRNFDIEGLKEKLSGVQILYHLGATGIRPTTHAGEIFETNIGGTYRMLQLARQIKVKRFVYCGSCFEYGEGNNLKEDVFPRPISEYGASKVAGWILTNMFARQHALPVVSLRLFTPYGAFEDKYRLVSHVILNALKGRDVELTKGEQTRDFVFIEDVCAAFVAAGVTPDIEGKTFNIASGSAVSIHDTVLKILELTQTKAKPLFGAQPYREKELWILSGDNTRAKDKLGWKPRVSLEEGLKKTIQWFKKNRDQYPVYTEE